MDRLWAPWRINYLKKAKKQKGCIFCGVSRNKRDYVILKSRYSSVILNIFPYNNGHLMASPLRHVRSLSQLKKEEVLDIFGCVNKATKLLDKVLRPDGYNIGINSGKASGAGITGHLHIHIVPRWVGDTNFMPTLGEARVISQSLDELYRLLKNA